MSFVSDVREVARSRELLVNLVRRELRSKYKGTALGWAWSLINPLATTAIFTVVFSTVMRVEPPVGVDGLHSYPLFLLCGLLSWNFLTAAVQGGQSVLLDNGNLIKKTYFPRRLLVISHVAAAFVSYLVEMGVLVAVFLVFGVNVLPWTPLVLGLMVLLAVFALGLALLLSVVNVYFRDVAHFVALFMQIWFYATPIIYPISLVEGVQDGQSWAADLPLTTLYQLNPMVGFVESVRDMLYGGQLPPAGPVLYALAFTLVSLWVGNAVFARLQGRLAEEL
ncbi:ABC transporter permease [Cellulomonas aerilata]|uniref:Transport permease protein n=1 Tax=Cellulomonas aerilata TaxID=515326 RepID=A0A512DDC2_9CELL|nr:ABC transporter permease [Cellulomonas aerilata]GEO34461.1 transport permease protein [Cellulomonas aerilata]